MREAEGYQTIIVESMKATLIPQFSPLAPLLSPQAQVTDDALFFDANRQRFSRILSNGRMQELSDYHDVHRRNGSPSDQGSGSRCGCESLFGQTVC